MEDRKILAGIGIIAALTVALSALFFWERGGLPFPGDSSVAMAQSAESRGSAAAESRPPVFRKKMRLHRTENGGGKSFETLQQDVIRFFHNLDQREYIKAHDLPEGTYKQFLKVLADLSANPPAVAGETKDLAKLRQNLTHLERVMGNDNAALVKDILENDKEILEPTADLLYEWVTKGIDSRNGEIRTSNKALYEYAAFFLSTLTGKAYLWRRDAKTRIVVTYYSILILDRANGESLNRHGVDILPCISQLKDDLMSYRNLSRRGEYLEKLRNLEDVYGRQRNSSG